MPLPGETMASATLLSSARFMVPSMVVDLEGRARPRPSRSWVLRFQNFDARQGLALEPFEERAARGRHIRESAGHSSGVEGGNRVSAAGDRNQLAGLGQLGRGLSDLDRGIVERLDPEGPDTRITQQGV